MRGDRTRRFARPVGDGQYGRRHEQHGRLSERFAMRFVGLDREGGDRDTVLVGDFRDPTQLEDLLGRMADCGLVVARVEEVREP